MVMSIFLFFFTFPFFSPFSKCAFRHILLAQVTYFEWITGVCRCTAYGQSGHYNTYDGQAIHFRGICSYTLSKLKSDFTDDKCYFNAVVKHVLVGNVRVRTVQVTIGEYTIHLRPNRIVWVSRLMLWQHENEDCLPLLPSMFVYK